jgi:hypothetical protein
MAAGSDSELGSSLDWRRLRDIAEPIVEAAWHASLADRERSPTLPAGIRVLLVSPASEGAEVERVLEESRRRSVEGLILRRSLPGLLVRAFLSGHFHSPQAG